MKGWLIWNVLTEESFLFEKLFVNQTWKSYLIEEKKVYHGSGKVQRIKIKNKKKTCKNEAVGCRKDRAEKKKKIAFFKWIRLLWLL